MERAANIGERVIVAGAILLVALSLGVLGCVGFGAWYLSDDSRQERLAESFYPGSRTSKAGQSIRADLWSRVIETATSEQIDWETIPEAGDEWGRPFRIHLERIESERLYALIESDGEPGGKHVWRFELFIRRNAAGEWERYHRDWWETDWTRVRPGASGLNDPIASEAIGAPPPIE